jgi:hypothetical protein
MFRIDICWIRSEFRLFGESEPRFFDDQKIYAV